jgi:hypothetical protein
MALRCGLSLRVDVHISVPISGLKKDVAFPEFRAHSGFVYQPIAVALDAGQ